LRANGTLERIETYVVALIQDRDERKYRDRRTRCLLWILRQLSRLFHAVVQLRILLFSHGIFRHHTLGCQVISIGNLTVGGTGKTPVVEIFARELAKAGRKVAILSRGYKKAEPNIARRILGKVLLRDWKQPPRVVSDGKTLLLDSTMGGDEPYMLASHLPNVVILVDKNRVKSGRYAIKKFGCDILILDDGFQYLPLKHRLDIVLVDRRNPFGNRYVLPRGILREPIRNIRRASFVFITKCDGSNTEALQTELRALNSKAEMIECAHRARYLQDAFGEERRDIEYLRGLSVTALSGIAAPDGFEAELENRGARVVCRERFADHHRYTQQQILNIINRSKELKAQAIITTEKDAVRFPRIDRRDVPIYFLRVDIELLSGTEDFNDCISRICFRKPSDSAVG
jgi:tetraacyldisaccharide 4'-kinase